jgi:hypothetical protein
MLLSACLQFSNQLRYDLSETGGTRWRSWLVHCVTSAGSVPDAVNYIFHFHFLDSASNRNEYQEYFVGIKAAGA